MDERELNAENQHNKELEKQQLKLKLLDEKIL